jgi:hypothetical protein
VCALAASLVEGLAVAGLTVRIFGGAGVIFHTRYQEIIGQRRIARDIDLVAMGGDHLAAWRWLSSAGWITSEAERLRGRSLKCELSHPRFGPKLDLFADPLYFSQRLYFGERLHLQPPSLAPADLLLTKDFKDVLALLGTWPITNDDESGINAGRIARVCGERWGAYYSCASKLHAIVDGAKLTLLADSNVVSKVRMRAGAVLQRVEQFPKPMRWRVRAWVGPRIKWYQDVE